jgi:predicted nucleotidyltransferase
MNDLNLEDGVLRRLCARHHIKRLSLFGSTLTGRARADSDMDLLVEFEPGQEPGFLGLAEMKRELSSLLGGRRIDLRTPSDLSPYFRDEVLRTARVQYAS